MKREPVRALRCAIYTRVSTEHGLEQEFNSLDSQREASEAYIKSRPMKAGAACQPATTISNERATSWPAIRREVCRRRAGERVRKAYGTDNAALP